MFSQMVYYLIEMINEYIIMDTLPNDSIPGFGDDGDEWQFYKTKEQQN